MNADVKAFSCLLILTLVPAFGLLAQDAPPAGTDEKKDGPTRPEEMIKKIREENEQAYARILEIEAIIYPAQDEAVVKLFGLQKGEFDFLRMQSESPKSANDYFRKQQRMDRGDMTGIAAYFDEMYEAIQAKEYWIGRESSLVGDDGALFNELKGKVMEELAKTPDGQKVLAMITERDMLIGKLKTSQPLYKYFSERRLWWKSYPEYETVVKEDIDSKLDELIQ